MELPSLQAAKEDPRVSTEVVKALLKQSLVQDWRASNSSPADLDALGAVLRLHLENLTAPSGGTYDDGHEEACASCVKLARNLCVQNPAVQEHWWSSGVVEQLLDRLRSDAVLADERGPVWCEAVPSFLTNVVAGHEELRKRAQESWLPGRAAVACSLCWRRPELAFMLVQTLITAGAPSSQALADAPLAVRELVSTQDGHCLLFVLCSLLFRGSLNDVEGVEAVGEKAWEWATIFFHGLWTLGGFEPVYRGLKQLSVSRLHDFWCTVNGLPAGCATIPPGVIERLVGRLCRHVEVIGLLWHTVHGLKSQEIIDSLLGDEAVVTLLAEEIACTVSELAKAFKLDWRPLATASEEACDALGVKVSDTDLELLTECAKSQILPEDAPQPGEDAAVRGASSQLFRELCNAVLELSSATRKPGNFPKRLTACCLLAHVSLLDALHRFRFGLTVNGQAANGTVLQKPPPEALEASQACCLVEQVRICANVLYENKPAQDFLRLIEGMRILFSHCYADKDLPLLREAGVFAVRNATHHHPANAEAARKLLAERKTMEARAAGQSEPSIDELGLDGVTA
eukprot:TRINITY_DN32682_c0_g1_i1.p1 TRINITY_DN32682_c0_g1~~TRINITY_DN32682_c0_g1_i1.p1  ORF type:complete len:572 (+),score=131.41 TRINITY_DN32682_c0_g1_i1:88-1803(+)